MDHFYSTYGSTEHFNSQLNFARTPYGWSVRLEKIPNKKLLYVGLLWHKEKGYQELDAFTPKTASDSFTQQTHVREWQETEHMKRMFRIHTFFNYNGWAEDAVSLLSPEVDQLNDHDLYSLARSYGAISMSLQDKERIASLQKRFEFDPKGNSLSKSDIQRSEKWNRLAVQHYKMLADRNPSFPTIVGKIRTKYANEVVQAYLDMFMFQSQEFARTYLREDIYDEDLLSHARNYLNSCPSDAILITFGDNDTYPLLYVQEMENLRTDVLVINYSLLNWTPYIESIRREYKNKGLKMSISPDTYENLGVLRMSDEEPISLSELVPLIDDLDQQENIPMEIPPIKEHCGQGFELLVSSSAYLYKHHIAFLDLYHSNPDRPFCGANFGDAFGIFEGHLKQMGMIYQLVPCEDWDPRAKLDVESTLAFLEEIDTTGYRTASLFPLKEDGDYIDSRFLYMLYYTLIKGMSNTQNGSQEFKAFEDYYLMAREQFAVKPDEMTEGYYEQIRERE